MKRILLLLMALFLSAIYGQERQDVIYLKNGDVIKGIIIEHVPNDYIKVELLGGSILTYKYEMIQKFTKETISNKEFNNNKSANTIIVQQQQQQQQQNDDFKSPVFSPEKEILSLNQKNVLYENQKKSPVTARVLSFLLSSAGHAYAGNWGRGLLFLGGRALFLSVAISAAEKANNSYLQSDKKASESLSAGALIGFFAVCIWEIVDAGNEVERYNQRVYNSIFNGIPNFGMDLTPMKDGVQLSLTYNF